MLLILNLKTIRVHLDVLIFKTDNDVATYKCRKRMQNSGKK